jgi:hypothetical protein
VVEIAVATATTRVASLFDGHIFQLRLLGNGFRDRTSPGIRVK